jgi:hypothetical protein
MELSAGECSHGMVKARNLQLPRIDFERFVRMFRAPKCRNPCGSAFVPDPAGLAGRHPAARKPLYVEAKGPRAAWLFDSHVAQLQE